MQQFVLTSISFYTRYTRDIACKIRLLCVDGPYHTHAILAIYISLSQDGEAMRMSKLFPSTLFVCELGQDKRIPYYRQAKHSLSLER